MLLNDSKLKRIEEHYNPEFDVPQQRPTVSWVEYELLRAVRELNIRVEKLEEELAQLRQQANTT